jgi:hypothetical protein
VNAPAGFRPRNGCRGTGVDLFQARANLCGPRGLSLRIHVVVEALNELAGESGALFIRELKGLSK